jgi:1-acyl-sn-glycerol-3-phosphate acyltransferase
MKWLLMVFYYKLLMRPFLGIFVGVKLVNSENLRQSAPVIIVSNHNSHLDTMSLMAALPVNQLLRTHPVAAADYFGGSWLKRFISRWVLNAILIKRTREAGDLSPTDQLIQFIDKGHSLILFPEGSRGEPEEIQAFQKGIGAILHRRPQVPYIPVFMSGMGRILPKGETLLVPFDAYVVVGKPRNVQHEGVLEIVHEVKQAVLAQRDQYQHINKL